MSRAAIVAVAMAIVERDGPEHLSMRALAKALSATPMALYHHVRDKGELLAALLDEHAARFRRFEPPADPAAALLAAARTVRSVLSACPWAVPTATIDDVAAGRAGWAIADMVSACAAGGLDPAAAEDAVRTVWCYLVGGVLTGATSDAGLRAVVTGVLGETALREQRATG